MAEKRDFMSELAKEISDKKSGKLDHIQSVEDYTPKHKKVVSNDEDFDIPQMSSKDPEPTVTPVAKQEEYVDTEPEEVDDDDVYGGFNGRPASYSEEPVVRVDRPKKQVPVIAWVILGLVVAGIAFAVYWFQFAAHITVPNFVGKNISEVSTWAKQNKMESSAIATSEPVYSLEYDKGIVVEQSKKEGSKVKPDTPITFTVSNGPDPDEKITFPSDLKSMTNSEIQDWISENKLLKTKVITQYSSTVENGNVISYEVKNGSEDEFTRGTTLNITVSKGAAPAGQVSVENFVGKTITEVESWANTKKIKLNKTEAFSDSVEANMIISMDKKQGDTLNEGDTLTVVVSKGKGVKIPNLVGYTKEQLESWSKDNDNVGVNIVERNVYNTAPEGSVISQSITPGTIVGSGDVLELTKSLYLPILQENSREWLGKDYLELKYKVDEWNSKGARIQAGQYGTVKERCNEAEENYTKGQIVEYRCEGGTSDKGDGCERPLTLDARISYTISTGEACDANVPTSTPETLDYKNYATFDELQTYADIKGITLKRIDSTDDTLFQDGSKYVVRDTDGKPLKDTTLSSGTTYVVYVKVEPTATTGTGSTTDAGE